MRRLDRLIARAASRGSDGGMTTAEYAVGTVAACSFGAVLYKIVTSSQVAAWLTGLIGRALQTAF
jgi:hypothetical protein